jgi:hypothetical protein
MKSFYLNALFFLLISIGGSAQLNYSFTASSGTYTPITGGTPAPLVAAQAPYDIHDEGIANGIPLGFTFNYNGTDYSTISACTNGFASFSTLLPVVNAATEDYYTSDLGYGPLRPGCRPLLAPLWDDLDMFSAPDVTYLTTGTAPNRVFTLQWAQVYWDVTATNLNIAFQVKLFETTNKIQFVYHKLTGALGTIPGAAIGITGSGIGPGNYLSLNDASSAPVASSSVNTYSISTKPSEGQVYEFAPSTTLPIGLSSFKGERIGKIHLLTWKSDSEQNNAGYEIQRSIDGVRFEKISFVPSKAANGNSSSPISYSYEDARPINGSNYYRLKQVNKNQQFAFSGIVMVKADWMGTFVINAVYPNPIDKFVKLVLATSSSGKVDITIADLSGKVYIATTRNIVVGENLCTFEVGNLAKGTYVVSARSEDGEVATGKFVK